MKLLFNVLWGVIAASALCALSITVSTFYIMHIFVGNDFFDDSKMLIAPLVAPSFAICLVGVSLYVIFALYERRGKDNDSV